MATRKKPINNTTIPIPVKIEEKIVLPNGEEKINIRNTRARLDVLAELKRLNFSPVQQLVARHERTTDERLKVSIASTLLEYCAPKMRAMEVKAENEDTTLRIMQLLKEIGVKPGPTTPLNGDSDDED